MELDVFLLTREWRDLFSDEGDSTRLVFWGLSAEGVVRVADKIATPNMSWSGDAPDPATSSAPYRLYNIGNNEPVELMHFIACIEKAVGKKALMNFLPMQAGDVPKTFANIDTLAEAVGFRPHTAIEEGVRRFVAWYRDYYRV